jgi:TPP-dependent trihydroxycyclohexane-1,2-dione (THcHDO) dehydratase
MTRLIEFIVTLEQTDVITDSENKRVTVNDANITAEDLSQYFDRIPEPEQRKAWEE